MAFIEVCELTKDYKVINKEPGVIGGLLKRRSSMKRAIDNLNFQINEGEIVGYIGQNGSGKSTTIKILTGILSPTKGSVVIDGRTPYIERKTNAYKIGAIFGQRSHLIWDLPVKDTFELYKRIYKIDNERYRKNIDFFISLLEIGPYFNSQVRQLSLGEKMRANLALALLHDPQIVFLDEPTIGLDVLAKNKIRQFIKEINREKGTTFFITSHDMDDIEVISTKILMIERGHLVYDGLIEDFKKAYGNCYHFVVDFKHDQLPLTDNRFKIVQDDGLRKVFKIDKREIDIDHALKIIINLGITNISVIENNIEQILMDYFANSAR